MMTEACMPYLTDAFAREVVSPSTGQPLHWDADADGRPGSSTSGFGLRITSGGARSWVLRYRVNETGTQRLYKIGRFPALKAERARKLAEKYAADVAEGHDPRAKGAKRARPRGSVNCFGASMLSTSLSGAVRRPRSGTASSSGAISNQRSATNESVMSRLPTSSPSTRS
jgi:hypothetical protein